MQFPATLFQTLHYPQRCEKRLRLHAQGAMAAEPSVFDELLRELGKRHEERHRGQLENVIDLSRGAPEARIARTREELRRRSGTLFQPLLSVERRIDGQDVVLVGSPDFMIPADGGWRIRDAKVARDIDKPGILAQLNLYGFLLEAMLSEPPLTLEAYLGSGEIATTVYEGGEAVLEQVSAVLQILVDEGKYEPVGWSKCSACGFRGDCWTAAERDRDVALLPDVDQGLARELHGQRCRTIADLYERFHDDDRQLADLRRLSGKVQRRVGTKAARILQHAQSFLEDRPIWRDVPALPGSRNLVMFDLEGLPPQIDEVEKVFLWGLKVCGDRPSEFLTSCAFPGRTDDRAAWIGFLRIAERLFQEYGDIPFVHWASYEKTKIRMYVDRYGDPDGTAESVLARLVDLLPIMKQAVCLPLPSYSLKQVEKYVGFQRNVAGKGDWAIAMYIQACETDDPLAAEAVIGEILQYNEEDLDATWAVYRWLQEHGLGRRSSPAESDSIEA